MVISPGRLRMRCSRETLEAALKQGPFEPRRAMRVMLQLAEGLAAYGLAHNFVPYRLTRFAAKRAPDEPIQAITALSAGVLTFGATYALFGWLAWHGSASLLGAMLYVLTLPFAGFWFFAYRRRLGVHAQRIVARTLFRTRPELYRGLVLEREQLLVELDAVRAAYARSAEVRGPLT